MPLGALCLNYLGGGEWVQGVWSATGGPPPPEFYTHSFIVDGVRTLEPKNATIKRGISTTDNMFFVAGKGAESLENRLVPHGHVRQVWHRSSTLDTQRRMHVYTPPGYDSGKSGYPVLYLPHGGGDEDDSAWSTQGRAGFIVDNLLPEKKAKPMLVVMPNCRGRRIWLRSRLSMSGSATS